MNNISFALIKFLAEFFSMMGSILLILSPLVFIISIIAGLQNNEYLYILLPIVVLVVGKIFLEFSKIIDDIED